jgi:CheY-like chemotaxis protein
MKILLVDDDPEIRLVASFALGRVGGHHVLDAADGDAALALARAEPPDLLLVDVMLGDDDGIAVAGRLGNELGPVPLIFLTGRTEPEDVKRMEAAGARGVITKPFDPALLAETVERMMGSPGPDAGRSSLA